jgi:hypothetical protein
MLRVLHGINEALELSLLAFSLKQQVKSLCGKKDTNFLFDKYEKKYILFKERRII